MSLPLRPRIVFVVLMTFAGCEDPIDHVFDCYGVAVLVDSNSAPYLEGTTIRFQDGKQNGKRGFVFDNPQALKVSD